jgi:hypothetical protein
MRILLGRFVGLAGFLVAAAWAPAAPAQYVRMNIGFLSTPGFTSMTIQPVIVPPIARTATRDAAREPGPDRRNDGGAIGWAKDGFHWGRGYRRLESVRPEWGSRGTSQLRVINPRDPDYRPSRPRPR